MSWKCSDCSFTLRNNTWIWKSLTRTEFCCKILQNVIRYVGWWWLCQPLTFQICNRHHYNMLKKKKETQRKWNSVNWVWQYPPTTRWKNTTITIFLSRLSSLIFYAATKRPGFIRRMPHVHTHAPRHQHQSRATTQNAEANRNIYAASTLCVFVRARACALCLEMQPARPHL